MINRRGVQVIELNTAAPGKQIQFLERWTTKKFVLLTLPDAAVMNTIKPYQFGIRKVITAFQRAVSSTKYMHREEA